MRKTSNFVNIRFFNEDGTEERSVADSFEAHVMRLTATESERRNIHKGDGR